MPRKQPAAALTQAAEWVAPSTLKPWADNPRNNAESVPEVMKSIQRFGFASPIIARREDGEIIAGHTRWEAAQRLGLATVPVRFMDLSLKEARALALADNKVGEIARWDEDKLARIVAEMQADATGFDGTGFEQWEVESLLLPLDDAEEATEEDSDAPEPSSPKSSPIVKFGGEQESGRPRLYLNDVPDALWPTDNEFDVPLLDLGMQADALDQPFVGWGHLSQRTLMRGTYHFFTSDDRFETIWRDPTPIVNSQCVSVIEVNYSTSATMPRAVALWGIYRKRWLARYWQSKGIRVFVDININPTHADLMLLGVPHGWKAYASRLAADALEKTDALFERCVERAGTTTGLLMIGYGGGKEARAHCEKRGWVWVPEVADAARGRYAKDALAHRPDD